MKKLLLLSCLLSAPAFATNSVRYDFTGTVDQSNWSGAKVGDSMKGSFLLNYDAPVDYQSSWVNPTDMSWTHYNAISGFTYEVNGHVFTLSAPTAAWTVGDIPEGDVIGLPGDTGMVCSDFSSGAEANLNWTGGDEFTGTDLANSDHMTSMKGNWYTQAMYGVGEKIYDWQFGGKVDRVSRYSEGGDAAPVPEPSTLALFGSALIGFAGLRRRKKS